MSMLSERDAADELEVVDGELTLVRATIARGDKSMGAEVARLERRRAELVAILDGYAAARAAQSERDRVSRLSLHVAAYNLLLRQLNVELLEIRANLPDEKPGDGLASVRALRPLQEVEMPRSPDASA
jgi:hypothetical protein